MPVLYLRGDDDDGAGSQADSVLVRLLVPALTGGADEDLAAAALGVVDVPVVPATGLKGHVGNRHAHITQGAQITGPAEILPGHRVGTALREQIVKFLIHIIRPLISTCRHR